MGCSTTRRHGWDDPAVAPVPAPLRLYRTAVRPEWVDYNGHMSEWCYLLVMGDSSDAFFRYLGIDDDYRAAGASLYTVETHIRNLREVSEGEELCMTLQVLGVDAKRVHVAHEIVAAPTSAVDGPTAGGGGLIATGEQMLLHVDARVGKASPLPAPLLGRLQRIAEAHSVLSWPDWVGHVMRIPPHRDGAAHPTDEAGATWTSS